jgi:hypothetical protein
MPIKTCIVLVYYAHLQFCSISDTDLRFKKYLMFMCLPSRNRLVLITIIIFRANTE